MDIETAKLGFQVLQFLATSAVGVYVYLTRKDAVTNDRISKLETDIDGKIDRHGERLATLEEAAKHSPSRSDIDELHDRVTESVKLQERLAGEFQGVKNVLNLIHEFLLKGGGR